MDVLSRKNRRGRGGAGSDDDSDDGPPPDPDEPAPAPVAKKEKKSTGEAKEVQVAVRRGDDKGLQAQGGMTQVRRDMLKIIHDEEDQEWQDYQYCDGEVSALLVVLLAWSVIDCHCRLKSPTLHSILSSRVVTNN